MKAAVYFFASSISNGLPATVIPPVRLLLSGFAWTVIVSVPEPVWFPPGTIIHGTWLLPLHVQVAAVVTVASAVPPFPGNDSGTTPTT